MSTSPANIYPSCSGNTCTWTITMSFADTCSSLLCLGGCAKTNLFNIIMPSVNVPLTSATLQVNAKWTDGSIYSVYFLDNEGGVTIFLNGQKVVEVLGAPACAKSCWSYPYFCSCRPPDQTYTIDITNLLQPGMNALEVREDIDCAISAWDLTITITAIYAQPVTSTTTATTTVSTTSPTSAVIYPQSPTPPPTSTKVSWMPIIVGALIVGGIIAGVAGYMSASPETRRKVRETAKRVARAAGRATKKAVTKGAELTKRAIARARGGQA